MAYASPIKIANGLVLDFTVDGAVTATDAFLGLNALGEVTQFASVPRSRVSGGGNITESTSAVLTITGGTAAVLTSGLTIQVLQAGAAQSGYLSTTDWNTFNNKLSSSLTSANIYVGNGSNVATGVAMSGDISITNTGNVQIVAGAIIDADVNAGAAIAFSKMAALTANRIVASNGSGVVSILDTATYPSLTELSYVKGVTSSLQTQIDSKLSVTLAGVASGDVISYNGAAWVNTPSSGTGIPTAGTTNQILRKIDNINYNAEWHTLVAADLTDVSSSAAELNKLTGVTTTATQFNFLNTLVGDVQSQLSSKLTSSLTLNNIWVGDASSIPTPLAAGTNGYVLTSVSGVPTWSSPGVGGTVTSVAGSGGTTGMSFTGSPITTSGTLTLTGTLAVANGGTSFTSYAIGDLLQATGATTLTKLSSVSAGSFLRSAGVTTASTWSTVKLPDTMSALGVWVANSLNTTVNLTAAANQSIRVNSGGTAWEAYTPAGSSGWAVSGNTTITGNTSQTGAFTNTSLFNSFIITPTILAATTAPAGLVFNGPAHTNLTLSTEAIDVNFNFTRTVQFATGALTTQRAAVFTGATYGFVGASTLTDAATLAISSGPSAGTNASITRSHALLIQASSLSGTISEGYGAYINAPTGASGNFSAKFLGGTGVIFSQSSQASVHQFIDIAQSNHTGGRPTGLLFSAGSHTTLSATNETVDINWNLGRTVQFGTGALALQRAFLIQAPTYGFVGPSTLTDAYTCNINGAPVAGTNATITRSWALGLGGPLGIAIGTDITSAKADNIALFAKNSSDGTVNATLALYLEQAVEAIGTFTASHKLKVWINGTEYWIQLDAV